MSHIYEVKEVRDKAIWERFLSTRTEANFLQSWQWGEFHKKLNKTVIRLGLFGSGRLYGVCCGIVENARRGRYLAVAGGPVIEWTDGHLVKSAFEAIRNVAKSNGCVYVRIRPQHVKDEEITRIFGEAGLRPAPMHLTADLTSQIDLTQPEQALLANMRKTTRYEIRKAESLKLRIGKSTNPADIDEFYDMQLETARRHGFVPFSKPFLKEQFTAFAEDGNVVLYKAFHEKELLSEAFVIFYGHEAAYHYGSSTDAARKYPGAYLIQWEAIKEAKRRGMTRYNLWGVVPEGVTNRRFSGVSIFKRGFGGHDVSYMPAHDLVIDPVRYALNFAVETVRHRLRRL